ncbi:IS21 family transposase, partial [Maribrevibacterium harenarium]
DIGPATREVIHKMLSSKPHPEQSYRSCLGLLNLSKTYGESRLEQACQDGLMLTKTNYTFINNLLKNNREGQLNKGKASTPNLVHSNVRGPNCYH